MNPRDEKRPIEAGGRGEDAKAEEITETNMELARQADAAGTTETTRLEDVSDGEVTEHPDGPDAEERAERILRDGMIWL